MTTLMMGYNNHVVLMPISKWQISLLLLVMVTSCSAQSIHYIAPTPDTPCPGELCHTLSQYVAAQYFKNLPANTTMAFLQGNHTLEESISVTNLTLLTLYGISSSLPEVTSRIVCTWPAGFVFTGITELQISSLAFISCGHSDSAAVNIISVQQSKISNCSFFKNVNKDSDNYDYDYSYEYYSYLNDHYGGALCIKNSNVILASNKFQRNSAKLGGVLHMDTSSSVIIGNTFEYNYANDHGGALHVVDTSLDLIRNTFQYNYAEYDGGALHLVASSSIITGNTFQNNTAIWYGGALHVEFSSLNFTRNTFRCNFGETGGALYVLLSNLTLIRDTFHKNFVDVSGGALYVESCTLNLIRSTFQDNSANNGGVLSVNLSTLSLTWNTFQNNSATEFGGVLSVQLSILNFTEGNIVGNNKAQYGGGIAAVDCQLELSGTTFESNTATYGGGLYVHNTNISGNVIVTYSSATEGGGGAYASQSTFNFKGESTIKNNLAGDGGGLLLLGESKLYLQPNVHVHFINNSAKHAGGAIKVGESDPLAYCVPLSCFFQIAAPNGQCSMQCKQYINVLNASITFNNNSAIEAGADLHGGSVDSCIYFSNFDNLCLKNNMNECPTSEKLFDSLTISENALDVSSDPLYICTCTDTSNDCSGSYYHPEPVYPGGTLEVPVIARGQRNGKTPAVIELNNTYNSDVTFEKHENIQNVDNKCTVLTYTIYSYQESTNQEITLYTRGPCLPPETFSNILTVLIDISHCPPGFQISKVHPKCVCAERLQKFTNMCRVDDEKVFRAQDAGFWVGYDSTSQGLILHPHCPFDYCAVKEMYLAVDDSDIQCNYNRSGLLCGTCNENLSLALGSSHCLKCSNSYLSLLVAFTFTGIILVIFLLVMRLTVAAGTINGLIFYANVVAVNSATFFQPRTTNILTVFIAWLNLDLGIESCFYDGMDAYVKTWLQFAFPLYVWALVGMIIIGSHYSGRVAKIFGSNPVATLATLFLLSYAKLLRTVIAALSYTYLEYPNNSHIAVWLYDGNIRYLSGKHIPLFIAAMFCLIFLFFPYTMLLIFSQCLQAKSNVNIFSYINSRYVKPFLDAYHAPYSNKHRYWTGLMLLFRFVLFLISAVNTLGDPNINLLAIASATTLILPTILGSRIYKTWSLGVLETSFIINLTILAVATLYIDRLTGGKQNAATFTSVGIAFITFKGIIIYHSIQQIKGTRLWRRVYMRHEYPLTNVASGLVDPPDLLLVSRPAPTQTVVSICYHELREPCMATD